MEIPLVLCTSPFRKKVLTYFNRKNKTSSTFLSVIQPCDGILPCLLYKKLYFSLLGKRSLITMDKKDSLKQFKSSETVSRNGTGFDSELFLQNRVKNRCQ